MFAAGAIGLAIALLLATQPLLRHEPRATARRDRQSSALREDLELLVSAPVLSCFSFFVFTSVNTTAMQSFSIPAIVSLYGVPLATAAGTLTGYLVGAAAGTLVGGFVAARSRRHGLAAGAGLGFAMLFVATLASGTLPALLLVATTTLAGFSLGTVNPSRDIIVREVTPEHARGKVYGFVYSGLDLGSSIAPPVIGWLIDTGRPRMVFLAGAAALLMSATLMLLLGRRRR
jgi:MFS family permease